VVSNDGKRVAAASWHSFKFAIIDVEKNVVLLEKKMDNFSDVYINISSDMKYTTLIYTTPAAGHKIFVFDNTTYKEIFMIEDKAAALDVIATQENSQCVNILFFKDQIKYFDVASGKVTKTKKWTTECGQFKISENGLIVGFHRAMYFEIYDSDGRVLNKVQTDHSGLFVGDLSKNSKFLLTRDNITINIWDMDYLVGPTNVKDSATDGQLGSSGFCTFSADQKFVVAIHHKSSSLRNISVTNVENNKQYLLEYGTFKEITSCACSPDSKNLVLCTPKFLKVIDLESGKEILTDEKIANSVICDYLDVNRVIIVGKDVTIFNMQTKTCEKNFAPTQKTYSKVTISKDKKFVFMATTPKTIEMWDISLGQLVRTLNSVDNYYVNPDASILIEVDSSKFKIHDLKTGTQAKQFTTSNGRDIKFISFSTKNENIFTCSTRSELLIYDMNGNVLNKVEIINTDKSLLFIERKLLFIFCKEDNDSLRIFDFPNTKFLAVIHTISNFTISPNFNFIATFSKSGDYSLYKIL